MSDDALRVLEFVRELAAKRRFFVQGHCEQQMRKRRVVETDLREALRTADAIRTSDDESRSDWTVVGSDLDGERLAVAVKVDETRPGWMEVVTVYEPDEETERWMRRGESHG